MRDVIADSGYVSNLEIRTCPICSPSAEKEDSEMQFLAFFDHGTSHTISAVGTEDANVDLSSVGTGFRYRLGRSLSVRADYAWQLKSVPVNIRSSRFHIGMTIFR